MKVDRITPSRDMSIRNFPRWGGGRPNLGFGTTGSRSIRSDVPESPTLGSNRSRSDALIRQLYCLFVNTAIKRLDAFFIGTPCIVHSTTDIFVLLFTVINNFLRLFFFSDFNLQIWMS